MAEDKVSYAHLRMSRQELQNTRRKQGPPSNFTKKDNLRQHGQWLGEALSSSAAEAREQHRSRPNFFVLKLNYSGFLSFESLQKHGVHFISAEDDQVCVVFSNKAGLEKFAEHLQKLGLEGVSLSYAQLLEAIEGIGNWRREDRQSWALQNRGLPDADTFLLDIELWPLYVADHPYRKILCEAFETWLANNGIKKRDKVNLDSLLLYRVELNHTQADMLLEHMDVRQVDLPPETGITHQQMNQDIETLPGSIPHPAQDAARVCILDTGIATNHPLLAPAIGETHRFIIADGISNSGMDDNGHGTMVAGIALYGDVEVCNRVNHWQPELWLLGGKVLNADCEYDPRTIENTLTEAVQYFVKHQGCRIFNLSLGNANSPYMGRHVQGMACLLDTLARELDVLFVVSTGNFNGSDDPEVPEHSWRDEYPEYLLAEQSAIIDPAPALNVLTVGSLVRHNATHQAQRHPEITDLTPADKDQPSPFTRHGPSIKGAIKPELVAIGGNRAIHARREPHYHFTDTRLGVLSCNHQFAGKTLLSESAGTSFAAPYITHLAGRLLNSYPKASTNLLRALLVNRARMIDPIRQTFPQQMADDYKTRNRNEAHVDVAGYGVVEENNLYRSTEDAVVLMAEEHIEDDATQFFELPLPEDFLRSTHSIRKIHVTLAYCPPVRTTRLEYRATRIKYRLISGASLAEVEKHFNNNVDKEGINSMGDSSIGNREYGASQRDRGTVQHSVWQRSQMNPNQKWFVAVTRNDYNWGESLCDKHEAYALVVTITDRENESAQLYTQIEQQLTAQARTRARI